MCWKCSWFGTIIIVHQWASLIVFICYLFVCAFLVPIDDWFIILSVHNKDWESTLPMFWGPGFTHALMFSLYVVGVIMSNNMVIGFWMVDMTLS